MSHARCGSFSHRSDRDDARRLRHPLERNVASPTNHQIRGLVAHQRQDFVVVHVVADGCGRVRRGTMDQQQLAAVLQGHSKGRRQAGQSFKDHLTQRRLRLPESFHTLPLGVVFGREVIRIERGDGAIGDTLYAVCPHPHQQLPGLEWLGARKT